MDEMTHPMEEEEGDPRTAMEGVRYAPTRLWNGSPMQTDSPAQIEPPPRKVVVQEARGGGDINLVRDMVDGRLQTLDMRWGAQFAHMQQEMEKNKVQNKQAWEEMGGRVTTRLEGMANMTPNEVAVAMETVGRQVEGGFSATQRTWEGY